eukprot:10854740-Lingulodinium_polyedra.AAC.1
MVMIVPPLSSLGVPLAVICKQLWPSGEAQVLLPHSARGLSVPIVRVLRHRRYRGTADQYE